ncbi:MAG: carbamoyltransferase HypF [Vulcanisaeta sp.]|nr:carbamoyltransferase HypF [Vulcanisaeta sp.]
MVSADYVARKIRVVGIVQGVGFRPYVKLLADKYGVKGYVRNLGGGEVEIHVEGPRDAVESLINEFLTRRPSAIYIEESEVVEAELIGFTSFEILESKTERSAISMIPPDLAICDECLREVLDSSNPRRYKYLFNSCSFCGPRFAVIKALPYDRHNTSWSAFKMCPHCEREYWDPKVGGIRRYYYQGISCKHCGPRVRLLSIDGEVINTRDIIQDTAKLIDEGYIVAIKGVGGYHIAALASDDDVVLKLRSRKKRPTQPFAVMVLDLDIAEKLVELNDESRKLLKSPQRPIVLLPKKPSTPVSKYVSPNLDKEGVFLPYTALHYLLLTEVKDHFLIMTSGNIHGHPMCTNINCVMNKLKGVVDYVLDHDLEIVHRVDDSVVRFTGGYAVLLRRSRGYAPMWIRISRKLRKPVVAFGADLQMAGAVAVEDKVIPTQYIGDLDEYEALEDLDRELNWFVRVYGIKDALLVCDANPSYASTWLCHKWAEKYGLEYVSVYHHHAHALATAADWGETETFVSITIDGVGYGLDGMAWGGEVLIVNGETFTRFGHLRYVPMPGGDLASIYPVRMVISYLSQFLKNHEIIDVLGKLGLIDKLPGGELEVKVVLNQLRNSIMTSSIGRFLDSVSALLRLSTYRSYEGEPAIVLEAHARGGSYIGDESIKDLIRKDGGTYIVDSVELFRWAYEALMSGLNTRDIAYTVQYSVGKALGEIACMAAQEVNNFRIYLSGGAAVNDYIYAGIKSAVEECGGIVRLPRKVPPGDGGIALGQVYYVALSNNT